MEDEKVGLQEELGSVEDGKKRRRVGWEDGRKSENMESGKAATEERCK